MFTFVLLYFGRYVLLLIWTQVLKCFLHFIWSYIFSWGLCLLWRNLLQKSTALSWWWHCTSLYKMSVTYRLFKNFDSVIKNTFQDKTVSSSSGFYLLTWPIPQFWLWMSEGCVVGLYVLSVSEPIASPTVLASWILGFKYLVYTTNYV